ncbi:U4/U6,U5 tri-snRNP-associated protein snu66 [Ceratobasidium sp. AG-Ba]|nr:U4/U6,U5 tri-snRNP-associated protein snu66 [Ceratobasidium sp. AG-Ba]QRW04394.1 U4/U6,U5 tri-snRNP-associated protein snu66 [Ceratobasidium sp. AG-Ba]
MEESISLEETNKIRISLGLKPLTDDKAPSNSKDQEAEENYTKRRKAEEEEKKKSDIAKRIAKSRNQLELNKRLVGATLGDDEDEGLDARSWIKRAKKKEKELAAKRQAELESMGKAAQQTYGESDLEGLKIVAFWIMKRTSCKTLTWPRMKRTRNDTNLRPSVEIILAMTMMNIDGTKQTQGFRLGGTATQPGPKVNIQDDDAIIVNRSLLSLDYTKNVEISDYLKEGDVGFKKPKTKKKRASRRNQPEAGGEPEAETTQMEVDVKPVVFTRRERNLDVNFVDDDELQAALARSRKSKARKVAKLTPEELAQRVAEEKAEAEAEAAMRNEQPTGSGLELDDTSEFVRSVTFDPIAAAEPKQLALQLSVPAPAEKHETIDGMEVDEREDGEAEEEDEEAMLNAIEGMITAAAGGSVQTEPSKAAIEEELDLGTAAASSGRGVGMASTLKVLRQQGILATPDTEVQDREQLQKQKDAWLASHRRLLAERELARLRSRNQAKDQSVREYENRVRDQQDAREIMDSFRDYKPDVELKYYDDTGRELDRKEAWKALSHRFHGKGSGRAKLEKRMKKIAEEKKREAMISGDTPLSMNKAFQTRQEKAGQAHMVLSVGNRGAVPQLAEFLDNRELSKSKTDKGKKKKGDNESTPVISSVDITGFVPVPTNHSVTTAPASREDTPASSSAAPVKMKPAFSRVAAEPVSGTASPAAGTERGKVAFGFAMKRKAEDGDSAAASPKRR